MAIMLPEELEWVLNILGFNWPEANEDKLMESAQAWRQFAVDLESLQATGNRSAGNVLSENYGKSVEGFDEAWREFSGSERGYFDDARTAALIVAFALDAVAAIVIACKIAVIIQLIILAVQLIAAAAAAPFTLGISAVASAGITQAIRLVVRQLLKMLRDAIVSTIVDALRETAMKAIQAIAQDLMRQATNVHFGAQDGIDVGNAVNAGYDAGRQELKDQWDNKGENFRDNFLSSGAGTARQNIERSGNNALGWGNNDSGSGSNSDSSSGSGTNEGSSGTSDSSSGSGTGSGGSSDGGGGSGGTGTGSGSGSGSGDAGSGSGSGSGSGGTGTGTGTGTGSGGGGTTASGGSAPTNSTGTNSSTSDHVEKSPGATTCAHVVRHGMTSPPCRAISSAAARSPRTS
ncbi:WXG100-like domain-containing protein, partial [Streptomyces alkaliterrae]